MPRLHRASTSAHRFALILFVLLVSSFATNASAGSIVFTDRTQFNAAAQPNVFENFDGPPPPCVFVPTTCTITYSGITFLFDSIDIPYLPGPPPTTPLGFIEVGPFFPVFASFQAAPAIGFDLNAIGTLPFQVTVTPTFVQPGGGSTSGPAQLVTQPGFLGFVGTDGTQLTGLTFTPNQMGGFGGGGSFAAIDNVAMAVPEPASILLFAIAASAIVGRRRVRL
jgi:hypothetical protein